MFKHIQKYQNLLRWVSGAAAFGVIVIPLFFYRSLESFTNVGYVGYFAANYFGYGLYILPFVVTKLNPLVLILIGAFGSTIDEFFAWYFGKTAEKFERKTKIHELVERYMKKYGLFAVFMMGLLPLPGFLYTIAGFVGGHYGIPYKYYFLLGFGGRLIRNVIYTAGVLYTLNKTGWLQ